MLPKLELAKFSMSLQLGQPLSLPPYKGSTFRGGFGHAFKKVVCIDPQHPCSVCRMPDRCVYAYVFETPPPSDTTIMRKYKTAPHPFIILPPLTPKRKYDTGDLLGFDLTLIGKAIDYLPYFIYSFEVLGQLGLGRESARYQITEVSMQLVSGGRQVIYQGDEKIIKSPPITVNSDHFIAENSPRISNVSLHFLTPARIVYNGHLTKDLPFHILLRNLIRRIALLSYFHCGGNPSQIDFKGLIQQAESVRVVHPNLQWYDWERYSFRQKTRMSLGGWVGEITYRGKLAELLPWLRLGEWVHVGKGTSFGLGKYELLI